MDFDNVGLLVGDACQRVSRVLVALDITSQVIDEAEETGAQLIVSHHPVIFHKLSGVTWDDPVGRLVMRLVRGEISAICMHTNLDVARGGVNDALADALGLQSCTLLASEGVDGGVEYGIGRVGELPRAESVRAFLMRVREALGANGLRYVPAERDVKRVAVGGGACGSYLEAACAAGCDAFVTADVKHDRFLTARDLGITLIDAGHFSTENPVCAVLRDDLAQEWPKLWVRIAGANRQPEEFYTGE